jgi:hypothetical protein
MAGISVGILTMPEAQASSSTAIIAASAASAEINTQPTANADSSPAAAAVQVSQAAVQQVAAQVKRAHHRWFWSARRHRWVRRHGASYAQLHPVEAPKVDAPMVAAVNPAPAILKQSTPIPVTRTASFYSEGDATVVNFDASAGKIETYEGRTFAIGLATQPGNATSWEDYRANVHYRCDQFGNCTLARKGVVVRDAKLEL